MEEEISKPIKKDETDTIAKEIESELKEGEGTNIPKTFGIIWRSIQPMGEHPKGNDNLSNSLFLPRRDLHHFYNDEKCHISGGSISPT